MSAASTTLKNASGMAPAAPEAGAKMRRLLLTVCVMMATIMQALDTTIANVALPHMQGSLQASQDQITWVLTSYIVAAAIATPIAANRARRPGVTMPPFQGPQLTDTTRQSGRRRDSACAILLSTSLAAA
mgnify:CR=1 FL=1